MRQALKISARIALTTTAVIGGLFIPALRPAEAQDARVEQRMRDLESRLRELPRINMNGMPEMLTTFRDDKRPVIGVTLGSSGKADTLGVLVDAVTKGGPADKAGVKEGDRITSVNGVNLRIASADANDPEMAGLGQRRLQRELAKAKPGDEVELHVVDGPRSQTVKVKTVSSAELNSSPMRASGTTARASTLEKRASLGVSLGVTGSVRDTLGLFISSVTNNGPAEKAGVIEGDRIAAINGVDVRLPKEDAEDMQASSARVNRFMRELGKAAPGDKVTLRVYSAGHYREVSVTAGNGAELNGNNFRFNFGDTPPVMMLGPGRTGSGNFSIPRISVPPRGVATPRGTVVRRIGTSA